MSDVATDDGANSAVDSDVATDYGANSAVDEVTRRIAELPWWRRPRRMQRQLSLSLAFVALVSVLLVGGLNFYAASDLLKEGTRERLVSVAEARTRSIENGTSRLLTRVSTLSSDIAVGNALRAFTEGFDDLADVELSADQEVELERYYADEVVDPLVEVGADVTVAELLPRDPARRALQYHYTLGNEPDGGTSDEAKAYVDAHETFHPFLSDLNEVIGTSDIMLVSVDGDIVYSVGSEIDLGTSLESGPYAETTLAETMLVRLPRLRTGDALISDFELYLPNDARPTAFAMAVVRSGTELLGALIVEVPIEALNAVTTANGQWEDVGLDDGESYLVGSDSLLRSESRLWIEDPDRYLSKVDDDELAAQIQFLGSPVGLQPVDTRAVRTALEGDVFDGRSTNYLGDDTFSYARLIDIAGVNWVVVADIPYRSAQSPLYQYLFQIGLTLAILLPAAALIGGLIARRVTKPIPIILETAEAVVEGERDPKLPVFGRNEFGDLAARLRRMAHHLGEQEADLQEQYDETRAVLLAALPPRAVDDDHRPTSAADGTDIGTAIGFAVHLIGEDAHADDALADLYASASQVAEQLAAERGIERVRAAADRYLFVAGLGEEDDGADVALDLASVYARRVAEFATREQMAVNLTIGISTGQIETGLMTRGSLSYTAWGEPVRAAMMIGSLLEGVTIGVDATTVAAADPSRWTFGDEPTELEIDQERLLTYALRFDDGQVDSDPDEPDTTES